jgi:membrane-associated phospholipid phosphatase
MRAWVTSRRSAVLLVCMVAGVSAAGVWASWWVFVVGRTGRQLDQLAMRGALHGRTTLWQYAEPVLKPVSVLYGAVALAVVVGIAVLRRRFALAAQAALLLGAAMVTTQVLKRVVLGRPDLGDMTAATNTLPSGHTTAAAATSAALLFVVGPRWRPAVAVLGAAYTTATGWSTLIGQWHRPADVLAAVLVVTAWSAVACLLLLATPAAPVATETVTLPTVHRTTTRRVAVLLAVTGATAATPALLATSWWWVTPRTPTPTAAYAVGVLAITAAACLSSATQLALRETAGRWATSRSPG